MSTDAPYHDSSGAQIVPLSLLEKGTAYDALHPAADEYAHSDVAHACALANVDLSRQPRVSDGEQYSASRAPRVSDGERFSPTPIGSHPLA